LEVIEAIKSRRSIRQFENRQVDEDILGKVIEAGTWAPSACNIQGTRFIIVKDEQQKRVLIEAGIKKLEKTPVGVFVLYDKRTNNNEYQDHIQSGAAAIQNMLLCAHALGLGAVWICDLPRQKRMRKLLGYPWYYTAIGLIRLGYPAAEPGGVRRKHPLAEVCHYESFKAEEEGDIKDSIPYWALRSALWRVYNLKPVKVLVLAVAKPFPEAVRERVKGFINRKFE
jgi:nitroreductase